MRSFIVVFYSVFLFLGAGYANKAYAIAGLGEADVYYRYTDDTILWSGEPSDICYTEKTQSWCFSFYKKNEKGHGSRSILLQAISEPKDSKASYALAATYPDGDWIIFDLRSRFKTFEDNLKCFVATVGTDVNSINCQEGYSVIFYSPDINKALDVWRGMGLPDPKIIKAYELSSSFHESDEISFGVKSFVFGIMCIIGGHFLWKKSRKIRKQNGES